MSGWPWWPASDRPFGPIQGSSSPPPESLGRRMRAHVGMAETDRPECMLPPLTSREDRYGPDQLGRAPLLGGF